MSIELTILIVIACLLTEGFFSGAEIAIISYDRLKLKHKVSLGHGWALRVEELLAHPERLLGTTLLGTNLSTIIGTTTVTIYLILSHGERYSSYSFFIVSPLILIFGEILPKMFYYNNMAQVLPFISYPIYWFSSYFFRPFIGLLSVVSKGFWSIFGRQDVPFFLTREDLRSLIDFDGKASDLSSHEKKMIHRIFLFSNRSATQVMRPLIDVVAINEEETICKTLDVFSESGFSRLPVYRQRVDNIIGVINNFDMLRTSPKDKYIKKYVRSVGYAPETQSVDKLLIKMQRDGEHMTIVVDEYGGAVGIVTIEDILEEIVGDIADEYDIVENMYRVIEPGCALVNARIEVSKLNEFLKVNIPEGQYETIGGFVLHQFKRIPTEGETLLWNGLRFTIKKATPRSIEELTIHYKISDSKG